MRAPQAHPRGADDTTSRGRGQCRRPPHGDFCWSACPTAPDDFGDGYRSRHGIEDTRQALLEARRAGVRSFCVTLDKGRADDLRHMCGPGAFPVRDDVRTPPLKIAGICRKLAI